MYAHAVSPMRLASPSPAPARLRALVRGRVFAAMIALFVLLGALLAGDGIYIKAKATYAQTLLDRAWSRTLAGETNARPWSWADTWPVAKLDIPRLGASSIVLNSVSGQAMAFGPGLMHGPQPGENGLAIISAHRDTHFGFLKHIEHGDIVQITNDTGQTVSFKISETGIVEADASGLYQDGETARIALVTCWPFDALQQGTKRFVAIGEMLDETT